MRNALDYILSMFALLFTSTTLNKRHLLCTGTALAVLGTVLLPFSGALAGDGRYKPRAEVSARMGTDRSLAVTEAWAPLIQGDDRVLYGDGRIMGDDSDNQEWNLGVGYRRLTEDGQAVLGVHGWIDRRKTARGSTFHQATAGFELMTDDLDVRANAYLPANESYSYETGSTGPSTPYLADTGIYYNTSGAIIESALRGLDLELSIPLPLFENNLESVRLSGGGFVFRGDDVETMRGSRVRATAEITPDVQIGARFENDNLRGSQGFLEATLRFPFGSKASGKTLGLRGRLDDSPERDVDVISGETIDTSKKRPVLSTFDGQAQRVFHVDNTASAGGDGSLERPFNTLAAANAAADRSGDVIYVNSGDGTTAGMDQGVTLAQSGQALIGSGRAFVYDSGRFTASNGGSFSGTQLKAAGTAPKLTNVNASADGVLVTADDVLLSGFTAQGATRDGIRILNASDTLAEGVSTNTNTGIGFYAISNDGQARSSIYLDDIIADSNGSYGVLISAENAGSSWDTITIQDANAEDNVQTGITVLANNGGQITALNLDNITANNNSNTGINLWANGAGSIISSASLQNINSTSNTLQGVYILATAAGQIASTNLQDITASNNTNIGVHIHATGAGSAITSASLQRVTSLGNTGANGRGVFINTQSAGQIGNATLQDITTSNNTQQGVLVQAAGGSEITTASLENITASNNAQEGVYVQANATGQIGTASLQNITSTGNTGAGARGVYVLSTGAGSAITSATLNDIIVSNNTSAGIYVRAEATGQIGTITLNDIASTGNTGAGGRGVYIQSNGAGSVIASATLNNITADNNDQHGIYVQAANTSSLSSSLENVTATGNTIHGVFIDDDTTGSFVADLGGGALGSAGHNRIFGNTSTDINVDLDNLQLKAESNWWGDAAGLIVGRRTLDGTSTIDADPFLATDPGP